MDSATAKRVFIAAAALSLCSSLGLRAREKEKPLLRVHEVIFSFGRNQKRSLEVSQNGGISLKGTSKARKAMLSAAELEALRDQ